MSLTYAKVIDQNNITATIQSSNGITFIKFSFQVYENANIVDETWDSFNSYTFTAPLTKFNWNWIVDADSGLVSQINYQFGNSVASFSNGEYMDLTGSVFNLGAIVSIIDSAINLQP